MLSRLISAIYDKGLALAVLAMLTLACNSTGGPTAPDDWLRASTKHGTVIIDPLANPSAVVAAIEQGFARARTRTAHPRKLDGLDVEGLMVVVNPFIPRSRWLGPKRFEITPDGEQSVAHELQHDFAWQLGIRGGCLDLQDHLYDNPWGGCSLDGEWAR